MPYYKKPNFRKSLFRLADTTKDSLEDKIKSVLEDGPKGYKFEAGTYNKRQIESGKKLAEKMKLILREETQNHLKKRDPVNFPLVRRQIYTLLRKISFLRLSLSEFREENLFPKSPHHYGMQGKMFLYFVKSNQKVESLKLIIENKFLVYEVDSVNQANRERNDWAYMGLQKKPRGSYQSAPHEEGRSDHRR